MVVEELFFLERERAETDGYAAREVKECAEELSAVGDIESGVVGLSPDERAGVDGMALWEAAFDDMLLEVGELFRD